MSIDSVGAVSSAALSLLDSAAQSGGGFTGPITVNTVTTRSTVGADGETTTVTSNPDGSITTTVTNARGAVLSVSFTPAPSGQQAGRGTSSASSRNLINLFA